MRRGAASIWSLTLYRHVVSSYTLLSHPCTAERSRPTAAHSRLCAMRRRLCACGVLPSRSKVSSYSLLTYPLLLNAVDLQQPMANILCGVVLYLHGVISPSSKQLLTAYSSYC